MLKEMAADEKINVVEKISIHVRINVGGSPLECPGLFLLTTCLLKFLIKDFRVEFLPMMM